MQEQNDELTISNDDLINSDDLSREFQESRSQLKSFEKSDNNKKIINDIFTISVTNTRSLAKKLSSLIETLEELGSDLAVITETWFQGNAGTEELLIDLRDDQGYSIIRRDRPGDRPSGGEAILYKQASIELTPIKFKKSDFEVTCALGRRTGQRKKILVIAAYIPPWYNAEKNRAVLEYLCDLVLTMKRRYKDPHVVVAGDINGRDLKGALSDYRDVKQIETGPTRG